jgi:hypothetical protein
LQARGDLLTLGTMFARRLATWALFVVPVFLGTHPLAAAPSADASWAEAPVPIISAPRQSLPHPVHDEATCAFCQAAAFAPHASAQADALILLQSAEQHETLSFEVSLPHAGLASPPRSRAPPILPV